LIVNALLVATALFPNPDSVPSAFTVVPDVVIAKAEEYVDPAEHVPPLEAAGVLPSVV
jgi:hypothetical protein